jgi:para-aminobenzoate synthetase component 2
VLGICLGHQAIAVAFGGKVVRSDEPMHGRTSDVYHNGGGVFADLPNPLTGCRYHSLIVDSASLPGCLDAAAHTADGVVMAVCHRDWPIVGLQFHPESALTMAGYHLLCNFLRMGGLPVPHTIPSIEDEVRAAPPRTSSLPRQPVTF